MTRSKESYVAAARLGGLKSRWTIKKQWIPFRLRYEENPKHCLFCDKPIPYEKRRGLFCNSSCAASHNNKGVRRHIEPKPRYCLDCGKRLKTARLYCDQECQSERTQREWVKRWESGEEDGNYKGKFSGTSKRIYRWLKETRGLKCQICERVKWRGRPIPLVLDHIDGDGTCSRPGNVRLICRNCDGQLPTFCGKNKGKSKKKFYIAYIN